MGDVKPWFMGEKPMFFHLSCFTNLFNGLVLFVGGSYGWWLRQLLPLGVGWHDCQSLFHTPTPPMTAFTPLSLDSLLSILPWSIHLHTCVVFTFTIMVCSFPPWSVVPHVGRLIRLLRPLFCLPHTKRRAVHPRAGWESCLCSSRTNRGSFLVVCATNR